MRAQTFLNIICCSNEITFIRAKQPVKKLLIGLGWQLLKNLVAKNRPQPRARGGLEQFTAKPCISGCCYESCFATFSLRVLDA